MVLLSSPGSEYPAGNSISEPSSARPVGWMIIIKLPSGSSGTTIVAGFFIDVFSWLGATVRVFEELAFRFVETTAVCGCVDWDGPTDTKIVVEFPNGFDFFDFHINLLMCLVNSYFFYVII